MGLSIFPKRSSFYFIFVGLRESGVFGRKKFVVERGYCRNFGGVSSALVLDDSDSCSNGESSGEYEPIVPIISRKRLHMCKELGLCSVVVRVYKSLSWEAARDISFERAMERYGLFQSITAFKMLVHIFAYVGMHMEMYALLKDIVFYFQKAEFELDKLLPYLLNSSNDAKISALVVDVLIKVFAANKMVENGVNAYFHATKLGLKLSNFSCNFLLKCLAEASRRELLQALFEEMKQFGPSPTVYTYTIMGDFVSAHKLLEEMISNNLTPNIFTLNSIINGYCSEGHIMEALQLIDETRGQGVIPNLHTYNAVIKGLCKEVKLPEGLSAVHKNAKSWGFSGHDPVYHYH
nr:putative pentatricopeptide repeat-containing protein At1g12700, mitochondrial isoform X1 [Ipomoea batatas]